MANALYQKFKRELNKGTIDVEAADIRAALVTTTGGTTYTFDATHEFLSSVPVASRLAVSAAGIQNLVASDTGTVDGDDLDMGTPSDAEPGEAIVLYIHTGVDATARLVAYIDTGSGIPFTLDGGPTSIQWAAGGIYAL